MAQSTPASWACSRSSGIIGAVLSIVGVIVAVLQGQYNSVFSNAVMALLQVICAGLAIKISNHAVYAA